MMRSALQFVPDEWGPKISVNSGAATRTCTGPNQISFQAPTHLALVMLTPQPGREVALNSDRKTQLLAPAGALELLPAGADVFARWRVDKENLLISFEPDQLARIAGGEFGAEDIDFRPPQPGVVDQKALYLATLLRDELLRGEGANALCVDALITLFGAHLLREHSAFHDRSHRPAAGGLSPLVSRRVADYIEANLSRDLSVGRLAEVAGLSPSHFLRAFRQSFGQAPHSYVLGLRLNLAERLATITDAPLALIAQTAGFSSNSHMTAAMRRFKGVAPSHFRRRALADVDDGGPETP